MNRKFPGKLGMVGFTYLLLGLTGCATLIHGTTENVRISSEPTSASIMVFNERSGQLMQNAKTPQIITLNKGAGYFMDGRYRLVIEKDGYATKEIKFEGEVNAWYMVGNLVMPGGILGYLFIDPLTGAMWDISPDKINIRLLPLGSAGPWDFVADEFQPPSSIVELCGLLDQDTCDLEFASAEKTIYRLNDILEIPDLYERLQSGEKLPQKDGCEILPEDILTLLEETEDFRVPSGGFFGLTFEQQEKLKKLNRRLIEESFPSPKKKK